MSLRQLTIKLLRPTSINLPDFSWLKLIYKAMKVLKYHSIFEKTETLGAQE